MTPKQISYSNTAESVIKEFARRGIEAYYCENSAEAVEQVLSMMEENSVVTSGGSATLAESGILDAVKNGSYTYIDRLAAKTPEESREIYSKVVMADYFLMSSNAITLDGQLVNIDGNGNRVACLITGPKQVIVVAGMNKLVSTVEEGINRVHNIAAPPNGVRLGLQTPCAMIGKCADCLTKQSMCSQVVITRMCKNDRIKVVLVGEELGF